MINIVVIGDIHGRRTWKEIVVKHPEDLIVFLGDYGDPYDEICSNEIISNLREIIQFKKDNPNRVILLLGNHDMHYIFPDFPQGSRYNRNMLYMYRDLFEENWNLFQYAWYSGNILFTHAGVTNSWWQEDFKGSQSYDAESVANQLNNPSESQLRILFQVGYARGGYSRNGGIFWADLEETLEDPLDGIQQVVGHTRVDNIITVQKSQSTKITYCDSLSNTKSNSLDCVYEIKLHV